jgi:hypothetical protein
MPNRKPGNAVLGPISASLDDENERLLHDIFMAYSTRCGGVFKTQGGSSQTKPTGTSDSTEFLVDAIDDIGWQQMCSDCGLDDDDLLPPARPVFKQIAKGNSLDFAGFVEVLKTVAYINITSFLKVQLL